MDEMAKIVRVCLTGPESTGKTTLAERLAAHYGTVWVPEFSRQYAVEKDGPLTFEDVESIGRGQMELEDRIVAEAANGRAILDTDLVSSVVYSRYWYDGRVPPMVEHFARHRLADLYLLAAIDVPFVPDPVRSSAEERVALYELFGQTLERFGARVLRINGDWDERYAQAVRAVEGM